jgi:hypothetical protein
VTAFNIFDSNATKFLTLDLMAEGYKQDVYSTSVKAGKRTYFFDVKATKGNDLYLTITESKRIGSETESAIRFEKHKIFLYKEDFEGFQNCLTETLEQIRELQGNGVYRTAESNRKQQDISNDSISDGMSFDDL